VPEREVVDLEKLNKIGIQIFFYLRPRRRRKTEFTDFDFEFWFI